MNKYKILIFFIAILFSFIWGMISQKLHVFPYDIFKYSVNIYKGTNIIDTYSGKDMEILEDVFVDKIIDLRLKPKINSLKELKNEIDGMIIEVDTFQNSYNDIEIVSSNIVHDYIHQLEFKINNIKYKSYSYLKQNKDSPQSKIGIIIIPGTGINQSSIIYHDLVENYQSGIDNITSFWGDTYIFVKPNEDFLAIHNGEKKISEVSYVNYIINHSSSSYSMSYIIRILALAKYLKQKYEKLYIVGISQGGLASLLVSLQSNPNKVIIASGYSIIFDKFETGGQNQIVIPNLWSYYCKENIFNIIDSSSSQFLFMWGKEEEGIYRVEAEENVTAQYFIKLKNVLTLFHKNGHVYDEEAVREFLKK